MNVLFLTLLEFETLNERTLYTDLLREFVKDGHYVYAVSPIERKKKKKTYLLEEDHAKILRLKIGNLQKTNFIEKGISTLTVDTLFKAGINKYFKNVRFDMVLYSTPPITLVETVKYIKKRDNAFTYLLLKDIFPQNAVDMGLLSTTGVKSVLYNYFRAKETELYECSDKIGCMSEKNKEYLLIHNPEILESRVEVCPNSFDVIDKSVDPETRNAIREKYELPLDKKVFIYGGNLGKPQCIPFIIACLKKCSRIDDIMFLIIGTGTEYGTLEKYVRAHPGNVKLMKYIPKEEYDTLVGACDVGMIFLDFRFTIPNFPSRLLSYMQAKIPVLAATDVNTDLRQVIADGGFGWWCESRSASDFYKTVKKVLAEGTEGMAEKEWAYLCDHYSSAISYGIIKNSIQQHLL